MDRSFQITLVCLVLAAGALGCTASDNSNSNTTATTNVAPPAAPTTASPAPTLSVAARPERITAMSAARGEQDRAAPAIAVIEPRDGSTITGSTVNLRVRLSGDLKGYKPGKDPQTGMGNHIHVILDNQPYEAYYSVDQPFELRNVTEGRHTLRVFPSRPWHESYKNEGAFQLVTFTVKGGGDASRPTTTGTGQVMSDNRNASATPDPAREGKEMSPSQAGAIDPQKPLLTYSRPKGEYKGVEADPIMIDFWLANAKLTGDGGQYRVRYAVDGGEARFLDKWEPLWLSGWSGGKHTVRLELVDPNGNVVDNGGYNATSREITVVK